MAKVYKVTMYLADANEYYAFDEDNEYMESDIKESLERVNVFPTVAEIKESDEFEWTEDLDINFTDATNEDFEKYIK